MAIRNPFKTTLDEQPPEMEVSAEELEVVEPDQELIPTLRPPEAPKDSLPPEQHADEVNATEVPGFPDAEVAYTLAKKISSRSKDRPNEDAALTDPKNGLLGVFDGLGGLEGSAKASAMARELLPDIFRQRLLRFLLREDGDNMTDLRERLWERTYQRISLRNKETHADEVQSLMDQYYSLQDFFQHEPKIAAKTLALIHALKDVSACIHASGKKIETTGCAGFVHRTENGKRYAIVANVGDSGAFVVRKNGVAFQITEDDSLVNELLQSHGLSPESLLEMKLNPTEKRRLPVFIEGEKQSATCDYYLLGSIVMRTLGKPETTFPSITVAELEPGDDVVFCTDGVIDKYETLAHPGMTVQELTEKPMELEEFGSDYRTGTSITEHLNELRLNAIFRKAYKIEDDIAIVAAHIPEETEPEQKDGKT